MEKQPQFSLKQHLGYGILCVKEFEYFFLQTKINFKIIKLNF